MQGLPSSDMLPQCATWAVLGALGESVVVEGALSKEAIAVQEVCSSDSGDVHLPGE